MTYKLVLGALRHDAARTYLSVSAIAFEVTMLLVLLGIMKGMATHPKLIGGAVAGLTVILLALVFLVSSIYIVVGRYATVYERSSELAMLKALGASPSYVFKMLIQETLVLVVPGTIAGIAMTLGSKLLIAATLSDFMYQEIAVGWWPISGLIAGITALGGSLISAWRFSAQDTGQLLSEE